LHLFRQAGDQVQIGAILGNLGYYELSMGDLDAARRHIAEAVDISRSLKARNSAVYETFNLGLTEYFGGSPNAAGALFAESLELARRIGMKSHMAYALIGVAGCGGADLGWSARLHGAADQALADLGHALEPMEERLAGLERQRLRAAMGEEAFKAGYAAGRTLDLASAAHQALRGIPAGPTAPAVDALVSESDSAVPSGP
jgi:hypothetical protein